MLVKILQGICAKITADCIGARETVGKRSQGLGNYQKLLRRRSHNLLHLKGLSNLSEGEYSAFQFAFTFHGGLVKLTRSGAMRMRCPEIGHPCLRMPYCCKIQPQLYFRKGIPRVCGSERRSPSGAMSYILHRKVTSSQVVRKIMKDEWDIVANFVPYISS